MVVENVLSYTQKEEHDWAFLLQRSTTDFIKLEEAWISLFSLRRSGRVLPQKNLIQYSFLSKAKNFLTTLIYIYIYIYIDLLTVMQHQPSINAYSHLQAQNHYI